LRHRERRHPENFLSYRSVFSVLPVVKEDLWSSENSMFQTHAQYIDPESGFHVIELRDELGTRHLIQIAIGHEACPACGSVYPKTNTGEIDPRAAAAEITAALNLSRKNLLAYAEKHGLKVRQR
jgi:hypothetical protein